MGGGGRGGAERRGVLGGGGGGRPMVGRNWALLGGGLAREMVFRVLRWRLRGGGVLGRGWGECLG